MNLAMYLAAVLLVGQIDVAVTLKNKEVVVGSIVVARIGMETDFGDANIEIDKLSSIKFGQQDSLHTTAGLRLDGKVSIDALQVTVGEQRQTFRRDELKSVVAIQLAAAKPGQITAGTAASGTTYHVHAPEGFEQQKQWPALLLFHGSNSKSKDYVQSVLNTWPELARDFVLIGIDGIRSSKSPPNDPRHNYSYVNFMGKSKYKGYPGTDRASPAFVAELLPELRQNLRIDKFYAAGHSQGGFLTLILLMHYPDLFAGGVAMSSGMVIQAEPGAFSKELQSRQRQLPIAIVHSENDRQVRFSMAQAAVGSYQDADFPAVRLFNDPKAGHAFIRLPVEEAVRWVQTLSSDDPLELILFAEQRLRAGEYRDASLALQRVRSQSPDPTIAERAKVIDEKLAQLVEADVERFEQAIRENANGDWIDEFLKFRSEFQFTKAADSTMKSFDALRRQHDQTADELYAAARRDFRAKKKEEGYDKYQQIVDNFYAATNYRIAKQALEKRK